MTLHVDEKSGEPRSVSYIFNNRNVVATYGDWRPVGNVKMPFRLDVAMGGTPILHSVTTRIQTNTNLTAAELAVHQ